MITMKDLGIIRRMYFRDGLSLSEIERRTGLTRKTVRRWLKAAEGTEPKYRRRPAQDTKIAPYAVQLSKALETDARRPTRDRRTALKLLGELRPFRLRERSSQSDASNANPAGTCNREAIIIRRPSDIATLRRSGRSCHQCVPTPRCWRKA